MNNFDTIYKDILSKDKVYLDLISHIKNFSANEKRYKANVENIFNPDTPYTLEQRLTYLHYRLFFALCMERVDNSFKDFSFIDNKYHKGKKLNYIGILTATPFSEFIYLPLIFNYEGVQDKIILKIIAVDIKDGQWDIDSWLDWPIKIEVMLPKSDDLSKDLGTYKLSDITKKFIINLIQ